MRLPANKMRRGWPRSLSMQELHIGIIGAGVVGLSTALHLQRSGFKVTLIDKAEPGMGASFGNAGLFADYARLPFARYAMLGKMPGMLMDSSSPLSLQGSYLPSLMSYGWHFVKACSESNYQLGKNSLKALQQQAPDADNDLLKLTNAQDLIRAEGCLGLFATEEGFLEAQAGDLHERQQQGVNLQFLSASEVAELEPDLAGFYAGGVFYPDTRFTVSPIELSKRYLDHFISQGGQLLKDEVKQITTAAEGIQLQLSTRSPHFDRVVICGGVASKKLLKPLGINMPLVSERGYHLTLETEGKQLQRPVGWLDKAVFITPMQEGIRLAGTAEFANPDAPENPKRTDAMLEHAKVMFGCDPTVKSTWVGSRPSTPDSLPVIGSLAQDKRIAVAFGHGHLGLTFGAVSGQLIDDLMRGVNPGIDLTPFAPERFN